MMTFELKYQAFCCCVPEERQCQVCVKRLVHVRRLLFVFIMIYSTFPNLALTGLRKRTHLGALHYLLGNVICNSQHAPASTAATTSHQFCSFLATDTPPPPTSFLLLWDPLHL